MDITKFVLGLGAVSIVLLVGSLNMNRSANRSLKPFAAPMFLVGINPHSYTMFRYTRNQSLGFAVYLGLIAAATR